MKQKLIIQIVTWNSDKFLKDCLDAVFNQTYRNFSVLVIDNGSHDRTIDILKKEYSKEVIKNNFKRKNTQLFIFQNNKNLGFSQAHNQGLRLINSQFVLILNPDIILEPDFLDKIMKQAEKEKKVGSFSGKFLQIKGPLDDYQEKIKTEIIDSVGLSILKNRHILERGQGKKDQGQYDKEKDIFGVTGASALYRRQALEEIKIPLNKKDFEYFDQDFFAYQEDADLAWRLQLRGWASLFVPLARAYHYRGTGLKEKPKLIDILKGHQSRPKQVEFYSFRNHLWLLLKNDQGVNFWRHFFWIFIYEAGKKSYLFFTKPDVLLKAGFSFWASFLKMIKKRKIIMENAVVNPEEMRKWMKRARFYQ